MTYRAVEMEREHEDAVLRLWKDAMSDPAIVRVADARRKWFYDENPTGKPRTVVALVEETREIVGCGSTFPRKVWANGRELTLGIPADFAVSKRHRVGGAALAIQRALASTSRDFGLAGVVGFPNERAYKVLERVGYRVVGEARAWVKPLRTAKKLEERIASRFAARAAGAALDRALAAVDEARLLRAGGARLTGELLDAPDARFDALWEEARARHRIAGERSRAFLAWRYARFTTARYRFFALSDAAGLVGWCVYCEKHGKALLDDMFARDMEASADLVLLHFARAMRREGMASIYLGFVGREAFARRLGRLGFFRTDDQGRSLVAWVDPDAPDDWKRAVVDRESWFMFSGEMDI